MHPNLSTSPSTIREASPDDLPAILDIINHAIVHTTAVYDYQPRSLPVQQDWFDKKQADNMPVVVAVVQDSVVGFGSYGIFRPWAAYQFSAEHSIYVAQAARRNGVGRLLLAELIGRGQGAGFSHLDWWHRRDQCRKSGTTPKHWLYGGRPVSRGGL